MTLEGWNGRRQDCIEEAVFGGGVRGAAVAAFAAAAGGGGAAGGAGGCPQRAVCRAGAGAARGGHGLAAAADASRREHGGADAAGIRAGIGADCTVPVRGVAAVLRGVRAPQRRGAARGGGVPAERPGSVSFRDGRAVSHRVARADAGGVSDGGHPANRLIDGACARGGVFGVEHRPEKRAPAVVGRLAGHCARGRAGGVGGGRGGAAVVSDGCCRGWGCTASRRRGCASR